MPQFLWGLLRVVIVAYYFSIIQVLSALDIVHPGHSDLFQEMYPLTILNLPYPSICPSVTTMSQERAHQTIVFRL